MFDFHGNERDHGSRRTPPALRVLAIVFCVGWAATTARAQIYEVVYDFASSQASEPHGPLIRGSDGNLYGTTDNGGSSGSQLGTVFRLNRRGLASVTFLHDFFDLGDGSHPIQSLLESSGYLFGSTTEEGTSECGFSPNTFRMDFVGDLSTIACQATPDMSALVAAFGGLSGMDVFGEGLFLMDSSGNATTLNPFFPNEFGSPLDGTGELLLASDGNVYGVGVYEDGGPGVLFRSDGSGNVRLMHIFDAGNDPFGRLVEQGGFLWGTTRDGGDFGKGTMFRMDFAGNFATLHSFAGAPGDGASPTGGLLVANTSSFYGTTQGGGFYNGGTLYQIDSFGNVVVQHSFGGPGDGANPGPLLEVDAALWGTTQSGGESGAGTIYVLTPTSSTSVLRMTPTAGPVRVLPGDPVQIHGGVFPVGEVPSVTIGGLAASNVQVLDQENISASTPPHLAPGTLNDIIIVLPDGTQASLEKAWLADFGDVPEADRLHGFVEQVYRAGLMDGCGGGNFCEGGRIDRATIVTMALKAKHGPAWAPPACTGEFRDVPCPGPEADWVEDAVAEGIAQPCSRNRFCPDKKLTRESLPEILLLTEHGSAYVPPSCTGLFKDVPCPGPNADAIEQVYREGIVEACSSNGKRYCPDKAVDRGPMAEYAAKAFRLP